MKKRQGFTLIELLAVIVILAIIALIATPIVINIIGKARKEAFKDSAYGIIKAGELYYALNDDISEMGISIFSDEMEMNHKEQFTSGIIKKKGNEITLINVGNGRYCANGTTINLKITEEDCSSGDKESPVITGFVVHEVTSSRITVVVEATDNTEVMGYYYSQDGGSSYTRIDYHNTYTFSGLSQDTEYRLRVKVEDYFGNVTESDVLIARTKKMEAPNYESSTTEWTREDVTVTINYPSNKEVNWIYEYQIGDKGWVEVTKEKATITFTENGSVIARVRDKNNTENVATSSTYNIGNIDKTPPTISISPTSVTIVEGASYSLSTGVTTTDLESGVGSTTIKEGNTIINSTTELLIGEHVLTYTVTDKVGNVSSNNRTITVKEPYKEAILNGAYPEIGNGMIPVTIENDGTVKKANLAEAWYSYADKKWANVVTVTSSSRSKYQNAAVETVINEADILTYFVWIPRYRYQLWNVNGDSTGTYKSPFAIQIVFENKNTAKSNGTTNGSWLTHPSFTFGEEINGYWVGKFETGYNGASSTGAAQVNSNDPSKVVIKPNTYSWRNNTVSNMFFTAQGMKNSGNVFGLSTSSDSHMMKNSEWGAVAYLSHSAYGTNKQVRINNSIRQMTGCAASMQDGAGYSGCENTWNTMIGYLASTTGNIYGVYDMSGGTLEYVMGYTTGASTQYGESGFTTSNFPSSKYVDIYRSTNNTQYSDGHLGDATKEVGPFSSTRSVWYQDLSIFVDMSRPWFVRGGNYNNTTIAGIFNFSYSTGGISAAFRVVLLGK